MKDLIIQAQLGLDTQAIEEWIEYRKFKKKPLSQFALDKSIKFLGQYPESHQRLIVDTAIMNDWQGLHHVDPPKTRGVSTRDISFEEQLTDTSWAK